MRRRDMILLKQSVWIFNSAFYGSESGSQIGSWGTDSSKLLFSSKFSIVVSVFVILINSHCWKMWFWGFRFLISLIFGRKRTRDGVLVWIPTPTMSTTDLKLLYLFHHDSVFGFLQRCCSIYRGRWMHIGGHWFSSSVCDHSCLLSQMSLRSFPNWILRADWSELLLTFTPSQKSDLLETSFKIQIHSVLQR